MDITATTLTGKSIALRVEATTTALQVKQKIEDSEGIPVDQQRLLFGDQQLQNAQTMAHYNIKNGDKLKLVLMLRGD